MNNVDKIVQESVNEYLLQEGFFDWFKKKKGVQLVRYDVEQNKIVGKLEDSNEDVYVTLGKNDDETKVTSVNIELDGKNVKGRILNMPQDDALMFIGFSNMENVYEGIDENFDIYYFYYDSETNSFKYDNGEEAEISLFPESELNELQGGQPQGGQQDGGYGYSQGGQQDGGYGYSQGGQQDGGYRYSQGGQQDGGYGYSQGGQQGRQPQNTENKILDLDRENPLSTAITKLIDSRQLRDSMTANYLIRYLYELDL